MRNRKMLWQSASQESQGTGLINNEETGKYLTDYLKGYVII
jgi:hypothetical protein